MRKNVFSSLEMILYMLALIPLAFSWGFVIKSAIQREKAAVDEILENAYQLSRFVALEESEFLQDAHRDLNILADIINFEKGDFKGAAVLASVIAGHGDAFIEIGATDRDGNLLFSTAAGSKNRNFSEREWFVRAMENRPLTNGNYFIEGTDNKASIVLYTTLYGESDGINAMLFAVLDVDRLNSRVFPAGFEAPANSRIIQIGESGTILVYDSENRTWTLDDFPGNEARRLIREKRNGIVKADNINGERFVYAVASVESNLHGRGVQLAICMPEKQVLEKPVRIFRREIAILAVVSLAALVAVWLTSRIMIFGRVRKMMEAAQRLSKGDMSARVGKLGGKDELDRLAQIIDGMAASLENLLQREKESGEKLKSSLQMIRNLARSQRDLREREGKRIAREIHDRLGQSCSVLKMDLSWLRKRTKSEKTEIVDKLIAMSEIIDDSLQVLHQVCSELRPVILDDFGLAAAIEWQAEEFQKRTEIECKTTIDDEKFFLNKEQETAIFRIYQEALTNISRHANATMVSVYLKKYDGRVFLAVQDNGAGISENQIHDPKSFGLVGIRERLYQWNGQARFFGEKGKGTKVEIEMPENNSEEISND